jgi:hypothetical protein
MFETLMYFDLNFEHCTGPLHAESSFNRLCQIIYLSHHVVDGICKTTFVPNGDVIIEALLMIATLGCQTWSSPLSERMYTSS